MFTVECQCLNWVYEIMIFLAVAVFVEQVALHSTLGRVSISVALRIASIFGVACSPVSTVVMVLVFGICGFGFRVLVLGGWMFTVKCPGLDWRQSKAASQILAPLITSSSPAPSTRQSHFHSSYLHLLFSIKSQSQYAYCLAQFGAAA